MRPAVVNTRSRSPGECSASPFPLVAERILTDQADRQRLELSNAQYAYSGLTDYSFGTSGDKCDPDEVFEHLRWGGQFVFISKHQREVADLQERYRDRREYVIETKLRVISPPWFGVRFLPVRRNYHYFVARKVLLTRADEPTRRHSYHVCLSPSGDFHKEYVVLKQIPTDAEARQLIAHRFPKAEEQAIKKSARKLVRKVFPLFLTRETAFLRILEDQLPDAYKDRFPRVIKVDRDEHGLVKKLYMTWLRLGGKTISQLEFAKQSAELLHVLHDTVRVIHLDLRLDNFLITERGVGFVDFGSAVRVDEDLTQNAMLDSLFHEMLSSSKIHRRLERLLDKGKVTSSLFSNCCHKIDKAVDLFYLVLQMNQPLGNPDFRGLVHYDKNTTEAYELYRLGRAIMKPKDPNRPEYRSAKDILDRIIELEQQI